MVTFYYGSDDSKIDITETVFEKCKKGDSIVIPEGDQNRASLFGDPCEGFLKSIYIEKDKSFMKYSSNQSITVSLSYSIKSETPIRSAIVAIAKFESNYINDFINYHLLLGFDKIFIYDNEDTPTYKFENENVTVIHFPGNNFYKAVQYVALEHFINNFINSFTHVAHIDIDELIVLKKHKNIKGFISEYIVGDCAGIGMNWRHFGSTGHTNSNSFPDIARFTKCEEKGNNHIKTIFNTAYYAGWTSPHSINTVKGYHVKNTKGDIIDGAFNDNIDFSVIQCNHYKSKTLPEFKYIRTRGRADLIEQPDENVIEAFNKVDLNEVEEYSALIFYSQGITSFLSLLGFEYIEGFCEQVPQQLVDLNEITKGKKNILEIGFNAGHSSLLFLENGCENVISFDIGMHNYTKFGKKYIDNYFPNRHSLILGDSNNTVPLFNVLVDVIFIDGGHDYPIAKADLINCKRFANKETVLILDDTVYNTDLQHFYNIGPTTAWKELIEQGFIEEIKIVEYSIGRGMSWGRYIF